MAFVRHPLARLVLSVLFVLLLIAGFYLYRWWGVDGARVSLLRTYLRDPDAHQDWRVQAGEVCGEAPFQMPTNGYIGFVWGDSFRPGHHHQGLDIFGGEDLNTTPVMAAYPGYLTRLPGWKSSVIVRIPSDPLQPGRQIWTYYTHMADSQGSSYIAPEFPPGTSEVFVEAGTLLGRQGNFSGDPDNPTGIHLHFSIVLDDRRGSFRNELEIGNTLDPSAYLGIPLNARDRENAEAIPLCGAS